MEVLAGEGARVREAAVREAEVVGLMGVGPGCRGHEARVGECRVLMREQPGDGITLYAMFHIFAFELLVPLYMDIIYPPTIYGTKHIQMCLISAHGAHQFIIIILLSCVLQFGIQRHI